MRGFTPFTYGTPISAIAEQGRWHTVTEGFKHSYPEGERVEKDVLIILGESDRKFSNQ